MTAVESMMLGEVEMPLEGKAGAPPCMPIPSTPAALASNGTTPSPRANASAVSPPVRAAAVNNTIMVLRNSLNVRERSCAYKNIQIPLKRLNVLEKTFLGQHNAIK